MNKWFLILPFIALLLVSCEQEENVKPVKDKSIRFSFSGNNELLRQASSASPMAIKATIRDAAGNVLVQRRTLNLHKFGEQYLSVPLTLSALENASYVGDDVDRAEESLAEAVAEREAVERE